MSGCPFPSPGDLPDAEMEPESPALAGGFFTTWPPGKNLLPNAGDVSLIPGMGRSSGEGNGDPLQYSCVIILWTEEPGRLQSMESQRVRQDR